MSGGADHPGPCVRARGGRHRVHRNAAWARLSLRPACLWPVSRPLKNPSKGSTVGGIADSACLEGPRVTFEVVTSRGTKAFFSEEWIKADFCRHAVSPWSRKLTRVLSDSRFRVGGACSPRRQSLLRSQVHCALLTAATARVRAEPHLCGIACPTRVVRTPCCALRGERCGLPRRRRSSTALAFGTLRRASSTRGKNCGSPVHRTLRGRRGSSTASTTIGPVLLRPDVTQAMRVPFSGVSHRLWSVAGARV